MELVRGVPITAFCDQSHLGVRERLGLFGDVCRAVQHAHQKGIIHRDLKPTNVLVTLHDDRAVVKVIDLGVAKATGQQLTDKTLFTHFAQMIGTPLYMSPEQAQMSGLDVDTRSDVYALGVLLYELMTGTTPFDKDRLREADYDELRRVILADDPPKPSVRIRMLKQAAIAACAQRKTDPKRLSQLCCGELDWIVMKALEKDRHRRYETASAFAADLQSYLDDKPVSAGPPSAGYRLRKFIRRNRGPVLVAAALVAVLVGGIVGTTVGLVWAMRAEAVQRAARSDEARRRRQYRTALDAMFSQVIEELLGKQKELLPEHKEFLKAQMASYEELARDTGEDEETRAGAAEAWLRVGKIRRMLGMADDAEAAYRRGQELYARLAADFPDHPEYRAGLAAIQDELAMLLRAAGRLKEAEPALREALALREQLAADFPDNADYRAGLAVSYNDLALVLKGLSQLQETEQVYHQALAVRRQLVADFPDRPKFRQQLAGSHLNLGALLWSTGRLDDAGEEIRQAVAIYQPLAADFPTKADYRRELALGHNNLGELYRSTRRWSKAEAEYHQALLLHHELVADFPARPDYRQDVVRTQLNLGMVLPKLDRREEAETGLREALTLCKRLVADFPTRPDYRHMLAACHNELGDLLAPTDRYADTETTYQEALALPKQLNAQFPAVADYQTELGNTLNGLAKLAAEQKNYAEAVRWLEQALPYHEAVRRANPRDPDGRETFSIGISRFWARPGSGCASTPPPPGRPRSWSGLTKTP
jgi:tetratricopeptide (TPR) repeat protein